MLALLPLLAVLTLPAPAQDDAVEREEFKVLGWNDACSVAVRQQLFPKLGVAIHGEPLSTRIGSVTIPPGEQKSVVKWFYEAAGTNTYDPRRIATVERALRKLGYARKGYPEAVRPDPSTEQPGLAETILSTRTLNLRPGLAWPGDGWRWAGADYSPLGTCALLVFESGVPTRYAWVLARMYNPRMRLERSRAHATNARLLFGAGELEAAVAEAGTAAGLAPESALARYVHAALLSMSGRTDESVAELKAAIELDPKRAAAAKDDRDFDNVRERRDFRDLVGPTMLDRLTR
ncbi:MAG: hypothetical protein SF051_08305 [Elusimicrobiota bacterium]|nr:hypothetical protein [Elusimicrobiota bacterium]